VVALKTLSINKSFNGVPILTDINFTLLEGVVHAVVGQNGAGKSTFMKILSGVYTKDSGSLEIGGRPCTFSNPQDARRAGISMVFQDFSLVPSLPVYQNIFLASGRRMRSGLLLDDARMADKAKELLTDIGVAASIDVRADVEKLSVGSRQLVEIAKALSSESKILILDEPTASLSNAEINSLFEAIRKLKKKGISIIYISHYLRDIFQICDYITVLRDGRVAFCEKIENTDMEAVISAMIGKTLEKKTEGRRSGIHRKGVPLIELRAVSTSAVKRISFKLWPGEIVGLAGLLGSGRTEIFNAIYGIDPIQQGEVFIAGKKLASGSVPAAIASGVAMIPEDRRNQGLILDFSVRENIVVAILRKLRKGFLLDDRKGKEIARRYAGELDIKLNSIEESVKYLSGGNQQKVVVAKSMANDSKILLLDDPTFGIDVKSKREIMTIIRSFVGVVNAALFISSEFEEIASFCDRTLIIRRGQLVEEVRNEGQTVSEERLLKMVQ
jgi:ribose transport system ATP-binding protein